MLVIRSTKAINEEIIKTREALPHELSTKDRSETLKALTLELRLATIKESK